jgi:hypothetical protein
MMINLIITAQQQIRAWLDEDLLNELENGKKVNIWAPKKLENYIKVSTTRNVDYYSFEENNPANRLHDICMKITHRNSATFRSLIIEALIPQKSWSRKSLYGTIKAYVRRLLRNKDLLTLLISKRKQRKVKNLVNAEILKVRVNFTPSDLNIVVSSHSDLSHEIVVENLNRMRKPLIQVMENWDNISSKVCPASQADALVVWGEQTRRHALEIHGFPIEKTHSLGSSRLNNDKFLQFRKSSSIKERSNARQINLFYPGFGGSHENTDFVTNMLNEINSNGESFRLTFRPHPLMLSKTFADKNSNTPELLVIDIPIIDHEVDPIWPILDYSMYTELMKADIVMGTPSTFLLEAMLLNKKIILDYRKLKTEHSPRELFESRTHFKEILESNCIPKLESLGDFKSLAHQVMNSKQDYQHLVKDLIVGPEEKFGTNLKNLVESLLDASKLG